LILHTLTTKTILHKTFFLLLVCFSLTKSFSQTCVVGRVFQDSIFFGADSRTTRFNFNGNKIDTVLDSTCKIHIVGKFAFSNIHSFADLSFISAKNACENQNDVRDIIKKFSKDLIRKTILLLQKYKIENPEYFKSIINDSIMCQTVFFGFQDSLPYLLDVLYKASELSSGVINIKSFTQSGIIFIAGETHEIDTIFQTDMIWNNGAVSAIDRLIGIEILAHSKEVAFPIDIIKITNNGAQWIRHKSMCANW
jgi:hypothetical protein